MLSVHAVVDKVAAEHRIIVFFIIVFIISLFSLVLLSTSFP
jgi:hypothetical protein